MKETDENTSISSEGKGLVLETNGETILAGDEALSLFRQGKVAWNLRMKENDLKLIDFSNIDFSEFEKIDFSGFCFNSDRIDFEDARFSDKEVDFSNTDFSRAKEVSFSHADFGNRKTVFADAKFGDAKVDFSGARFGFGGAIFDNAKFGRGYKTFGGVNFEDGVVLLPHGEPAFTVVASFSCVDFGTGDITFVKAKFGKGIVDFSSAIIGGNIDFYRAVFKGCDVNFKDTEFCRPCNLTYICSKTDEWDLKDVFRDQEALHGFLTLGECLRSTPSMGAYSTFDFSRTTFRSTLSLDYSLFDCVPDFTSTRFERDVSMEKTRVEYLTYPLRRSWRNPIPKARRRDSSKYRKMRGMAASAGDFERELDFFSYEQRSKFLHSLNAIEYFPILLFNFLSDFGRSLARPITALLFVWGASTYAMYKLSSTIHPEKIFHSMVVSTANLLPFLSWSNVSTDESISALFGDEVSPSFFIHLIGYLESFSGLILIFLVALAIRNRIKA